MKSPRDAIPSPLRVHEGKGAHRDVQSAACIGENETLNPFKNERQTWNLRWVRAAADVSLIQRLHHAKVIIL
jgi:hypothetical protein